ncbi:unnamed protein product [Lasius platythorax]|uniref:Reverse transcriptase n=3 Tax=Lasius TaxID=488720 RepID=A0A0J7MTW9_LASNI|nr:reverse transcriptase [Lasius niger]
MARSPESGMSYHLTQAMTGHGCFGKFLHRIRKRRNPGCDFCEEEVDDAIHTLRECPAWDPQRTQLKGKLGLQRDFTLGDIIDAIARSEEHWTAFSAYVQEVMREKEDEERRRERERASSSSFVGEDGSD